MNGLKEIKVKAPATVSNVGPGFDLLGFALEEPGDELLVRRNGLGKIRLFNESGCPLPLDPEMNIAAVAARSLLREREAEEGFDLVFLRKIPPGSGVGSSAASCVAAVVGVNALMDQPFDHDALLPYALEGEKQASGAAHADNVAPSLLGGMTLIRSYDPLDIKHLPYPEDLWCAVVHPELQILTQESRKLIPEMVPLATALQQNGNLAALVAALATADYGLLSRAVQDYLAEPYRIKQVPDFKELKENAVEAGSLGCGLSGSGPSIFSLCRGRDMAQAQGQVMQDHFSVRGIASRIYLSPISQAGCKIL